MRHFSLLYNCAGTYVWTTVVYWSGAAFFMLLDIYGVPRALLKYKIQEDVKVSLLQQLNIFAFC